MANAIVDCPQCGKKYSVPEGSPPGEFQCTDCGTSVAYGGAPASARPARARPARARPARGAARARPAGRRGGGRRRGGRDSDDEGGGYAPAKKDNTALFAVLGLVAVVIIAVVIVIVASGDDDSGTPVANTNGRNRDLERLPTDGTPGTLPGPGGDNTPASPSGTSEPETRPESQPEPGSTGQPSGIGGTDRPDPVRPAPGSGGSEEEPSGVEPAAENAPSGGFYGMDRSQLFRQDYEKLVTDLDHLEDTSSDLRSKIDEKCRLLVDYWATTEQLKAREDLAGIGRPAAPKVIAAFRNVGDISDVEGMVNACNVDGCLRELVGRTAIGDPALVQMARPGPDQIKRTIRSWYIWWYSKGYKMETFPKPEPEDEEG